MADEKLKIRPDLKAHQAAMRAAIERLVAKGEATEVRLTRLANSMGEEPRVALAMLDEITLPRRTAPLAEPPIKPGVWIAYDSHSDGRDVAIFPDGDAGELAARRYAASRSMGVDRLPYGVSLADREKAEREQHNAERHALLQKRVVPPDPNKRA